LSSAYKTCAETCPPEVDTSAKMAIGGESFIKAFVTDPFQVLACAMVEILDIQIETYDIVFLMS